MRYENSAFTKSRIAMDGNEYVGCTFTSCNFVFGATGPVTFTGNDISGDSTFEFTGAAAYTLNMLKGIWAMGEAGRQTILKTFREIAPDLRTLN